MISLTVRHRHILIFLLCTFSVFPSIGESYNLAARPNPSPSSNNRLINRMTDSVDVAPVLHPHRNPHATQISYARNQRAGYTALIAPIENQVKPEPRKVLPAFTPKDPNVFGYHFTAYANYPFSHFFPNDHRVAGSAPTETVTPPPEPILYEYKPQKEADDGFDSAETEAATDLYESNAKVKSSPNSLDTVVVGVENMVFIGDIGSGQHLRVVIQQGSDGLQPELEDESEQTGTDEYFPSNLEIRIHSERRPDDDELTVIKRYVEKFLEDHKLNH